MKVRKWLPRALVALMLLALVGLVGVWLAVQHVPVWYAPARVAPQRIQAVKDDATQAFADFSDRVNRDEPFEIKLSQDQVNRWLAVRDEFGPEVRRHFPRWLSDPMVVIERDKIGLAGTVSADGIRSVVSLWFEIELQNERVLVKLTDVQGGSLPVPKNMVLSRVRAWIGESRTDDGGGGKAAPRLGVIEQLLAGKRIENRFWWENGKRDFRLLGLELMDGALRLRAQACPDSPGLPEWSWNDQASDDWPGRRTSR